MKNSGQRPKRGIILYTSRSGQQYPSFFDEDNDYFLEDSISYIYQIIQNYDIDLPHAYSFDLDLLRAVQETIKTRDCGSLSIIPNEPSYKDYKQYL